MTTPVVKIGQKIDMFIPNLRLRRTPGPGKINDFTNKKIFLLKEANAQNHNLCIKMHSPSRNPKIRFFSISRVVFPRSLHFRSFKLFGLFKNLSGFRSGLSVLYYYKKMAFCHACLKSDALELRII